MYVIGKLSHLSESERVLSIVDLLSLLIGNVTSPRPGRDRQHIELDLTYIVTPGRADAKNLASKYSWRGLWAQCHVECQWFWQYDYQLQSYKLTPLRE